MSETSAPADIRAVVGASAVGTIMEWYDFSGLPRGGPSVGDDAVAWVRSTGRIAART